MCTDGIEAIKHLQRIPILVSNTTILSNFEKEKRKERTPLFKYARQQNLYKHFHMDSNLKGAEPHWPSALKDDKLKRITEIPKDAHGRYSTIKA